MTDPNLTTRLAEVLEANATERPALALELLDGLRPGAFTSTEMAMAVVRMVEDTIGFHQSRNFIADLQPQLAADPRVRERDLLALAKLGNPDEALRGLVDLAIEHGESAERWGLIGGRHKELFRGASNPDTALIHLHAAIESYECCAAADPTAYYASLNLSNLYRSLPVPAEEAARLAARVALGCCNRAIVEGTADEWANVTLLGLAFATGDSEATREVVDQVIAEGLAEWKLASTIKDLEAAISLLNEQQRLDLEPIVSELRALLGPT